MSRFILWLVELNQPHAQVAVTVDLYFILNFNTYFYKVEEFSEEKEQMSITILLKCLYNDEIVKAINIK